MPWVRDLVDAVSATEFRADLEKLVAFGTRHSTSASFLAAVEQARDRLTAQGYYRGPARRSRWAARHPGT